MASRWDEGRLSGASGDLGYTPEKAGKSARRGSQPRALYAPDRILIAEDMPSIAWLLFDILSEAGYDIAGPAATAAAAIELAAKTHLDAALLDIHLADGPSFAIAESLAARNIPFAFLSGDGTDGLPPQFHGRPIIGKPMSLDNVLNMVKLLCRLSEDAEVKNFAFKNHLC